jgi:hypothetical protein
VRASKQNEELQVQLIDIDIVKGVRVQEAYEVVKVHLSRVVDENVLDQRDLELDLLSVIHTQVIQNL